MRWAEIYNQLCFVFVLISRLSNPFKIQILDEWNIYGMVPDV
jgi:hypothetical protein